MKQINNFLCLSLLMGLSIYFAACKKNDTKILDWTYPSHLQRDPDLIGTWYSVDPIGNILDSIVFHSDGKVSMYEYDIATKKIQLSNKNISNNGKQVVYWSSENGILTRYDLRVFSDDTKPITGTYPYRFSITKDSLYYTNLDDSKPNKVRKMP